MQPLVQLEVDELRELGRAAVARVGLRARVEPHVRLQVRRRAEALLALGALVRLLTCNKAMLHEFRRFSPRIFFS